MARSRKRMHQHIACCVESIEKRASALAALWDAQYAEPGAARARRVGDNTYAVHSLFMENPHPTAQVRGTEFYQTVMSRHRAQARVRIWTNTTVYGFIKKIYLCKIKTLENNKTTLCTAHLFVEESSRKIDGYVVIKFRKHTSDPSLAELELGNILATLHTPSVRDLYPYFCCAIRIETEDVVWEGIMMKPLKTVPRAIRENTSFYKAAFHLLHRLHREGYAHGNPNGDNFVMDPEHEARGASPGQLYFTDRTTLAPFPLPAWSPDTYFNIKAPADRQLLTAKFMVAMDFTKLLFARNLHLPWLRRMWAPVDQEAMANFIRDLSARAATEPMTNLYMVPCLFTKNWFVDCRWDTAAVYQTIASNESYHRLLDSHTLKSITETFKYIFTDDTLAYSLNDSLRRQWAESAAEGAGGA